MKAKSDTEQRRHLIDAVLTSIERRGLCETSVSTVTEIAGVSRGMVTYWFATKSALLVAAYEHLLDEWNKVFFSQTGETAEDRIIAMTESMFVPPNFDDRSVRAWIAFSVASLHDHQLQAVCHKAYGTWREALRDEIRKHNLETGQNVEPATFSASLMALADGLWLRSQVEPDLMPPERARLLVVENIRRML